MNKKIIIDANFPNETRVALLDIKDNIEDIEYETANKLQNKGNIYLAKITRIEPSLQAAFIDYGTDKSGFISFSEIHPDYYHIPISDQKSSINNLKEITPPEITQEDLKESKMMSNYAIQNEDELNIKDIERLIDEKISSDYDLDIAENDLDSIIHEKEANSNKHYKIQEVVKKGQVLLVQITKEERGNKGASFTTFISLAGKYCVLMPNKPSQNGISRKISNVEERKRLKNIISQLTANLDQESASIIARTAAMNHSTLELKRDYDYLARLWNKIREATLQSSAPCFIHEEEGIIQKTIRDMLDRNVKEVIIQGEKACQTAHKFMREILPTEIGKIKDYKNKVPIFTKFNIEDQLSSLYQPVINLPSGGYIVINPTEALIAIDVNSGKATSERNIEETAIKTNLEAAREIARQIKLRDLSGLLVIDFIDMYELRNRKIIERSLKEFLSRDKAKIQTGSISSFGLLEMSRQRMRSSFSESNSSMCFYCNGKGLIRADESNSLLILRTVENEICNDNVDIVNVYTNMSSSIYLLNNKRKEIRFIEDKYNIKLNFFLDHTATSDNYSIEKIKSSKKGQNQNSNIKPATHTSSANQSKNLENKNDNWKLNNKNQADIAKDNSLASIESINQSNKKDDLIISDTDTDKSVVDEQNINIEKAKSKRNNRRRINRKAFIKKSSTNEISTTELTNIHKDM
ncbi:MAG: Rne/Rng family ribonuclease [Rickettsiaceae bacterium]|nr:MAG: Rne/Rng family ribonuclease [Rickettsiaceae bacterium]